jgi:hypothetical protein
VHDIAAQSGTAAAGDAPCEVMQDVERSDRGIAAPPRQKDMINREAE